MDQPADTIFGRILRGEIPSDQVHSDDLCIAFRDVQPQAPVHLLVIPRQPLVNLADASAADGPLLGHLLLVAAQVARQEGLTAWRTVINSGAEAGQTVFHLHFHLIPRYEGVPTAGHGGARMADPDELAALAKVGSRKDMCSAFNDDRRRGGCSSGWGCLPACRTRPQGAAPAL